MERELNELRIEMSKATPLPDIFASSPSLHVSNNIKSSDTISHDHIVQQGHIFLRNFKQIVEESSLDQRFAREVSLMLQQSLWLFRSSFSDCKRVLALSKQWNLDINHLAPVLEAGCREEKWKETADIFRSQIDPDAFGFAPMLIDVKSPIGLFVIAKDAQQRGLPVAESVMEAAIHMSMVNPTDQQKYVLAAGVALGYVGAWKELIEYQASSFNSARLGQPLIGAAMYACILCNKKDESLKLYQKVAQGPESEWQWSGGPDVVEPLLRDIAMRAGGPDAAKLLLKAFDEGFQVSFQASLSVIEECQSTNVITAIMESIHNDSSWIVDGNDLEIMHRDDSDKVSRLSREQLERLVLTIARATNHASEFGLSMLCYEMFLSKHQLSLHWQEETASWLLDSDYPDDHLSAIMTALCGFGASKSAESLYKAVTERSQEQYPLSFDIYQFMDFDYSREDNFPILHRSFRQLIGVTASLPNDNLASSQIDLLLAALAKLMASFNNAKNPRAGLFLSKQIQTKILSLQKSSPTVREMVRSFLGVEAERPNHAFLARNDELLAETVRAMRMLKMHDQALSLFRETIHAEQEPNARYISTPLAVNQALETLIAMDQLDVAMKLFQSIDESGWTPEMFLTLGRAFERKQEWEVLGQLYRQSLHSGCLTEEMGILALKGLNEIPYLEKKIRIMRQTVTEICRITGQVDSEWLYENYWKLKRKLGPRYTKLLMWWNDPKISDLQELQVAIEQFTDRKMKGLAPRNDVLRAILRHCQYYEKFTELIIENKMNLPVEKKVWKDLVLRVAMEAQKSTLKDDSKYIEDLVSLLRKLEENEKAGEYLSDAILRGVQVDKSLVA